MLKINLLPQEYRAADRTPVGTFVLVVICTILSVSAVCVVAFLYFSLLKGAEAARDIAKQEHENLAPMAKYADDLEKEKTEYIKRSQVIQEIGATRILWTKKLDQLAGVINNRGDQKRHWVWLKEFKMKQDGGRDPGVDIKGYVAGDRYEQLSNFNKDLKNHELFRDDFIGISNPTGILVDDDKMIPPWAIKFSWRLALLDKSKMQKPVAPPPRPAAGAKTQ